MAKSDTLGPNLAAMQLYEFLGERESDTSSLVLPRSRRVDLSEAIENSTKLSGLKAYAGIPNGELDAVLGG